MADRAYWLDVAERAAKTAAQALAGVLSGSTLVYIDWQAAAVIVGTAVLGSLLTSLASLPVGDSSSASMLAPTRPRMLLTRDSLAELQAAQARPTAAVVAKLDEILRHVKPVEVRVKDVRVKKVDPVDQGRAARRPDSVAGVYPGSAGIRYDPAPSSWWSRPDPTAVAALGRHAAVDAQTGEDDDTTPYDREIAR